VTALTEVDTILRPSYGTSSLTSSSARTDDNEILIELKDVHKSFGNKKILRGVNIKIRRGETVGIIGGSGTGKSTTLRLMAGLLAPDSVQPLAFNFLLGNTCARSTLISCHSAFNCTQHASANASLRSQDWK
jgi:ABC-type multidrug transport system ATPase subunit